MEDADKMFKAAIAVLVAVVVGVAALRQQVRTLQPQRRTRRHTMTGKWGSATENREAKGSLWLSVCGTW